MGAEVVKRCTYTPAEVDRALLAYMITGENGPRTVALLKAEGVENPPAVRTLYDWANGRHADRYAELQVQQAPKIAERIAAEAESLALRFAELERQLAEQLEADVKAGRVKDVSGALRNVSTSKALQIDKLSSPLRGRPTVITSHVDPAASLNALARKVGLTLEGTAVDVSLVPTVPTPPSDAPSLKPARDWGPGATTRYLFLQHLADVAGRTPGEYTRDDFASLRDVFGGYTWEELYRTLDEDTTLIPEDLRGVLDLGEGSQVRAAIAVIGQRSLTYREEVERERQARAHELRSILER